MNIYIKNDAEIQAIAAEGKVHGIGNILLSLIHIS